MELSELVAEMTKSGQLDVRETKAMSWGERDVCKAYFTEAFRLTDLTAEKNGFEWLPEYDEVVDWMTDTKGKGLCLVGSNGRGKSAILFGVLPVIFRMKNLMLKPVAALELGTEKFYDKKWAVAIDDIGQEQIINDYGTKIDQVEAAISYCELRMKLLFVTSNLNEEQLQRRYGVRITDRINRLCRIVVFKGKSLRK